MKTEKEKTILPHGDADLCLFNPPPLYLPTLPPEVALQAEAVAPEPMAHLAPRPLQRSGLGVTREGTPAAGTRSRQTGTLESTSESTIFPLQAYGPTDDQRNQPLQYSPFSSADLYNWKTHNPSFSESPQALIDLLDSILFSHQPTWGNCQQLLQTLFKTEERQQILLETRKNVPGADGRPTLLINEKDAGFLLARPSWNYNTPEGRERMKVYHQPLMAGL